MAYLIIKNALNVRYHSRNNDVMTEGGTQAGQRAIAVGTSDGRPPSLDVARAVGGKMSKLPPIMDASDAANARSDCVSVEPFDIIISGVPKTGKTTFGDWLQRNRGFLHVNMEEGWPDSHLERLWKTHFPNIQAFINAIRPVNGGRIVFTKGFALRDLDHGSLQSRWRDCMVVSRSLFGGA